MKLAIGRTSSDRRNEILSPGRKSDLELGDTGTVSDTCVRHLCTTPVFVELSSQLGVDHCVSSFYLVVTALVAYKTATISTSLVFHSPVDIYDFHL